MTPREELGSGEGAGSTGERRGASHWAGEPIPVWERRWGIPLLEAHDRLGSTNDRIRALAVGGARPFSVVIAEAQTSGRGRGGSRWHSPPGLGLWMSVLLPGEPEGRPPLTPLLVGLAVARAIRHVRSDLLPGIKWPNDVLIGGRKVSGILCEGTPGGDTVAGLGVNVHGSRDDLPPEIRSRATTLEAEVGGEVRRTELAGAVVRQLRSLLDPPPPRLEGALAREVQDLDVLRGRTVRISTGERGRGAGIDPDGALVVRDPEGRVRRIVSGSVDLV